MLQVKLRPPTIFNCCLMPLCSGRVVIVDRPAPVVLQEYIWRAVKWHNRWYAVSTRRYDGTPCRVSMHRLIANTPHGEVCHHFNKNSLDNRGCNLLNQMPVHHAALHGIRCWDRL